MKGRLKVKDTSAFMQFILGKQEPWYRRLWNRLFRREYQHVIKVTK